MIIIRLLELRRRDIADRLQQTPVVEPIDPFERRELNVLDMPPRSAAAYELGLVQADNRFGQCVVVAVADTTDRRLDAGLGETLRVADRNVLDPAVAVMHQAFLSR